MLNPSPEYTRLASWLMLSGSARLKAVDRASVDVALKALLGCVVRAALGLDHQTPRRHART